MDTHLHDLLVIDDDGDARLALRELLELHGYHVTLAADGAEGLAYLRCGTTPCLVLLDLRMPGMNGWQFREEQMRDSALARIPIVVFSGDASEEAAAAQLGLRQFLRKPLDVDRLLVMLERHCGRASSTA